MTAQIGTLAARTCRILGVIFTVSAALNLAVPDLARPERSLVVLVELALFGAILTCYLRIGRSRSLLWPCSAYLLALVALAVYLLPLTGVVGGGSEISPNGGVTEFAALTAITNIASMLVPTLIIGISDRPGFLVVVLPAFIPVLVLAVAAGLQTPRPVFIVVNLACYWVVFVLIAIWLAGSNARAGAGIARLARAHAAERRSSEIEAERRSGARLQHDTVLATLTLIAHGGAGVDAVALSAQARSDAELLRRLRTVEGTHAHATEPELRSASSSDDPPPTAHSETDAPTASLALAERLQALDRRHSQSGLRITWHGDHHVGGSSSAIDALLGATSECLENVRRHAGIADVDVTVGHDDEAIRITVTDVGRGFDPHSVPLGRLGLAQSVQARVRSVGGTVRVFSAPGRGTSVLMVVPR